MADVKIQVGEYDNKCRGNDDRKECREEEEGGRKRRETGWRVVGEGGGVRE